MKSRYVYDSKGEIIYAEERGIVKLNRMAEQVDAGYYVMGDIEPYRSMADGSMIMSRSRHREHLKQHGCVEVGNDSSLYSTPKPLASPPGLKEEIIRTANAMLKRI